MSRILFCFSFTSNNIVYLGFFFFVHIQFLLHRHLFLIQPEISMICTVFKTHAGTAQTNASFSAPPAAVGAHEGPPELGAPDHVHEEVGRRVDAHEEVAEGDEGVDEAVGGAVVLAAEEALVDVGDELEALAAEEEEGDADQGGAELTVFVGGHGHLR